MPCHVVLSGYDNGTVVFKSQKYKKFRYVARNRGLRQELWRRIQRGGRCIQEVTEDGLMIGAVLKSPALESIDDLNLSLWFPRQ